VDRPHDHLPVEMVFRYGAADPQGSLRPLYLDRRLHDGWTTAEAHGLYMSQLRWVRRVAAGRSQAPLHHQRLVE
jgi:hypothetical protein